MYVCGQTLMVGMANVIRLRMELHMVYGSNEIIFKHSNSKMGYGSIECDNI